MPIIINSKKNGVNTSTSLLGYKFPINESYWRSLSPQDLNIFAEQIFNHYRLVGFPYYKYSDIEVKNEYIKSKEYCDTSSIIMDDVISQSMHGLSLCWSFFPHHNEIKCGGLKSPMEAFLDDDTFRTIIKKRLDFGTYISDSGIRKTLKIASGLQAVSNFRPTAACAIYRKYGGGVVYDMSAGFGGRMLGAYLSDLVTKYICTDPSSNTHVGLVKLSNTLNEISPKPVEIYNLGSEELIPAKDSLDICFTSPPYFDTEKYADEPTQSYIKYPDRNSWLNGFLGRTIRNCEHGLKSGGFLIVNIANVKTFKDLETRFTELMKGYSFEYVETLKYSLSSICKSGFKYEPVFVYRKN